jgi:RNA polymerase sigma-70 factor, ECF subfamily
LRQEKYSKKMCDKTAKIRPLIFSGYMDSETKLNAERLMTQARAGTPECLGRLLQYYCNYLKLLVATHIDEKLQTRCSPSDIVQETYCEAHRDFEKFRGTTEPEFLAWLKAILVNNMAREVEKHLLAAKRDVRREISLDMMGEALERSAARLESILVDQGSSPSANIHRYEHTILLANHLAKLPPDYQKVLIFRHCEGLPFKDIAERMGRTTGAIRMLWLRAIGQIREQMGEKEIL